MARETAPRPRARAPTTFDAKEDAVALLADRRAEIQMEVWAPDATARQQCRMLLDTHIYPTFVVGSRSPTPVSAMSPSRPT